MEKERHNAEILWKDQENTEVEAVPTIRVNLCISKHPSLQGRGRSQEWVRGRKWGLNKSWQRRICLRRQVYQSRERMKEEQPLRIPMNEPGMWKKSHVINQHTSELAGALETVQFCIPTAWMGNQDPKNMKGLPRFSSRSKAELRLESRTPAFKSHN